MKSDGKIASKKNAIDGKQPLPFLNSLAASLSHIKCVLMHASSLLQVVCTYLLRIKFICLLLNASGIDVDKLNKKSNYFIHKCDTMRQFSQGNKNLEKLNNFISCVSLASNIK